MQKHNHIPPPINCIFRDFFFNRLKLLPFTPSFSTTSILIFVYFSLIYKKNNKIIKVKFSQMTLFLKELNNFFIIEISGLILDYSHFPRKLKLIYSLPFERDCFKSRKQQIKWIQIKNDCLIELYYQQQGKEFMKHSFSLLSSPSHSISLNSRAFAGELVWDIKDTWTLQYSVPKINILKREDCSLLHSYDLSIHAASLGGFHVFENHLYALDTWKGKIQVYEMFDNTLLVLKHFKTINLRKYIYQSRYFHDILVTVDIILISGGDNLFLFDHFGKELIVIDFPGGKDPAFVLQDTYLFIVIKNLFIKYQFE